MDPNAPNRLVTDMCYMLVNSHRMFLILTGLEAEELCEASDMEKQKATNAANNIISILTYYKKHTDRLLCGKRCTIASTTHLSSSLNISLGRIKQSFVL